MMKHILIIKTGSTLPSLLQKRGDFEDWIIAGMESDTYIGEHREALLREGKNTDRLIETCVDTPFGSRLLQRFAAIVGERISKFTIP